MLNTYVCRFEKKIVENNRGCTQWIHTFRLISYKNSVILRVGCYEPLKFYLFLLAKYQTEDSSNKWAIPKVKVNGDYYNICTAIYFHDQFSIYHQGLI